MMTAVQSEMVPEQVEQPAEPLQEVNPYRRVKVYELNHLDKWEDKGTGYVSIRTTEV